MKTLLQVLFSVLIISNISAQDILFSDDFESGTPSGEWGLFWADEEGVTAVDMTTVPEILGSGGDYAGLVQDMDGSYTGASMAIAGTESDQNYTIEADVYCYVNNAMGSAYTGIVAYADSSVNYYVKLVADFDGDNRFRLYNNVLGPDWQYSFHHAIDATGLYDSDGWHSMALSVETLGDGTVSYTAYFDGQYLAGPFIDDSEGHTTSGRYGIFSFQMSGTGLPGYFDNVIVSAESDILLGELNNDGGVDVLDVVIMVDIILGGTTADDYQMIAGDLNSDGAIDVLDVVGLVDIILDSAPPRSLNMNDASIQYGSGLLTLTADADIAGIELNVTGDYTITGNNLPSGWQIHNNVHKILIFDMNRTNATQTVQINYDGEINLNKAIVADWFGNGVHPNLTSASQFTLNAAYPNPFNPSTSISYSLTDNNQVRVEIYNINGKLVETLVNEYQTAGLHQIMWNAAGQSSGVYFIKVTAQNLSKMQKVVYIK